MPDFLTSLKRILRRFRLGKLRFPRKTRKPRFLQIFGVVRGPGFSEKSVENLVPLVDPRGERILQVLNFFFDRLLRFPDRRSLRVVVAELLLVFSRPLFFGVVKRGLPGFWGERGHFGGLVGLALGFGVAGGFVGFI